MLKLDLSIHARPDAAMLAEPIEVNGQLVRPIANRSDATRPPFAISFEQAAERITALDAMIHLEPDGWFIWHSPKGEQPVWQINGNLYDRNGRVLYVPLRGACPEATFRRLLAALAKHPEDDLMFELTHAGVYVGWDDLIACSRA